MKSDLRDLLVGAAILFAWGGYRLWRWAVR